MFLANAGGAYETVLKALPWILGGGAVGGFISHEISRRLTTAAEERKYLGRALCELLETRSLLANMVLLRKRFENTFGTALPPGVMPMIYASFSQVIPMDWGAVRTRYSEALTALAGLRPVLAYQLRTKDLAGPFLERLAAFALTNEESARTWAWIEQFVAKEGLPDLAYAVLLVARKHGWLTWWRSRRSLKLQDTLDPKLQLSMDNLLKKLVPIGNPSPEAPSRGS